ncbi:MAG: Sua5/YciO/YrdC/YwlC family protein [Candidatus Gracilibacteria bacterium]|nr:Sua5/YciO/YrdC/YwlC family protein [Candidatus Gracilibacteria bacterium]
MTKSKKDIDFFKINFTTNNYIKFMIYIIPTDTCFGLACPTNDIEGYTEIYKLKNRDYSKLIAIMLPDFESLEKYTFVTDEQIEFLKNYNKPFSVLLQPKNKENLINKNIKNYNLYDKISFRVASEINKDFLNKTGAIFLTSANISGFPETYKIEEIKEQFGENFKNLEIIGNTEILAKTNPSDIIEFDKNNEIIYLRKN